jgi:hypothetical protein
LPGPKYDAGLPAFAFEHGKYRIRRWGARNGEPDIQPLRHCNREPPCNHRCDPESVDGDQLAIDLTQIDMKGAH